MESELDLDILSSLDYTPLLSPGNPSQQPPQQQMPTSTLSPLSSPALPFNKRRESSQTSSHMSNKRSKTPSTTPLLSSVFDFLPDMDLQLPPPPNIDSIKKHTSVLINPNHMRSANSSPVILPSSYPLPNSLPNLDHAPTPHTSAVSNTPQQSAIGTSILTRQNSRTSISGSAGGGDKKMTHKLAEQGRRNRMNVALQDLDKLIPDDYKRDIIVPSKATTVEMGCAYIKQLQDEIQRLKSASSSSTKST